MNRTLQIVSLGLFLSLLGACSGKGQFQRKAKETNSGGNTSPLETQLSGLREELKGTQVEQQTSIQKLNDNTNQAEMDSLGEEIDQTAQKIHSLEKTIEYLNSLISTAQDDVSLAQEKMDEAKEEAESRREDYVNSSEHIENLSSQISEQGSVKSGLEDAQINLENKQNLISDLGLEITQLDSEIEALENKPSDSTQSALVLAVGEELNEKKKKRKSLVKSKEEHREDLLRLQTEVNSLTDVMDSLNALNQKLKAETIKHEKIEEDLDLAEDQQKITQSAFNSEQKTLTEHRAKMEQSRDNLAVLLNELERIQERNVGLSQQSDLAQEIQNRSENIMELKRKIRDLEEKIKLAK